MDRSIEVNASMHINPDTSMPLENQLLTTKIFLPITSCNLISRPYLHALLDKSLEHPFTLVSAPAGFGKTTLLATWAQSLQARTLVAWVSLDEEDNEPRLFWAYILSALDRQQSGRFTRLLGQLQLPSNTNSRSERQISNEVQQGETAQMEFVPRNANRYKYLLVMLVNLLAENNEHFLLILDDYQVITEPQVHTAFSYLLDHLPAQLHIILATRTDPPLLLPQLRARGLMLEVRTDQLRCTVEETRALFEKMRHTQLPDETIQEITTRTEGWLVGLQLLGLSLVGDTDPATLLKEISGDHRYILDFLTQEVLRRQSQDVQTFLLSTCILDRLTASLCDTVMQASGSQRMLERLEKTNLFISSLDAKRQWYRYHALFAEALHYHLEEMHADLIPTLHHRASFWYAEHGQIAQAILHALSANQWPWAANLIERYSLLSFTWGMGLRELAQFQHWLEQLPGDIMYSRPRLCLAITQFLWAIVPYTTCEVWLSTAEATLTASLTQKSEDASQPNIALEARKEQENLLGEVIAFHAFLQSYYKNESVLPSCQQALSFLSADNLGARSLVAYVQLHAFFTSSENDAQAAVQHGLQAGPLAQAAGHTNLAIQMMAFTVMYMIGAGQLHAARRLNQQVMELGTQSKDLVLPEVGWSLIFQSAVLCEWNQLGAALELIEEAIELCKQSTSVASLIFLLFAYSVLSCICLSCSEIEAACSALDQLEHISLSISQPFLTHIYAVFATVNQVRVWLAHGELDRALRWYKELHLGERNGNPFIHEREEMAYAYILLEQHKPDLVLQRLEPIIQRAVTGQRWGHVIEARVLQALAYHMLRQETQALDALSHAVQLAEPEGYIRSFVDEGAVIETLLYRLRKRQCKHGMTPYLDIVLAAFHKEKIAYAPAGEAKKVQVLPEPLSERELQVLQLLAHGLSNLEIAQELFITVETVKRHIRRIFSKLGVQNRLQAVKQAKDLDILTLQI